MCRATITLAAAAAMAMSGFSGSAAASDGYRISGPVVHENLAIYLVHGPSAPGPVPLTLQEALANGSVRVNETGNVNELEVENRGAAEVFIQSGEIVKGGRQDRALTASLILPPHSGKVPLASFCVEQGRWSARGGEDSRQFTTAASAVPSRAAKIAMKAPTVAEPNAPPTADVGSRQSEVWKNVTAIQHKLARGVGAPVAAPQSASSLQLSLENEKLKDRQAAYVQALQVAGEVDGVVGYVFAVNGKLNSADIYPSNGLFRKMWPKLLAANATEAIGETGMAAEPALPSTEQVLAFLDHAEHGKAQEKALNSTVRLETREADQSLYFETRRAPNAPGAAGGWVHRSYLAK